MVWSGALKGTHFSQFVNSTIRHTRSTEMAKGPMEMKYIFVLGMLSGLSVEGYIYKIFKDNLMTSPKPLESHAVTHVLECGGLCGRMWECEAANVRKGTGSNQLYCDIMTHYNASSRVASDGDHVLVKETGSCPEKFLRIGCKCYVAETVKLSRDEAQAKCTDLHPEAHLIEIQTAQKKDAMIRVAEAAGITTTWVSAYRPDGPTDFTWVFSGDPVTYADWNQAHIEPDMNDGENCVLYTTWPSGGQWTMFDYRCGQARAFICEL